MFGMLVMPPMHVPSLHRLQRNSFSLNEKRVNAGPELHTHWFPHLSSEETNTRGLAKSNTKPQVPFAKQHPSVQPEADGVQRARDACKNDLLQCMLVGSFEKNHQAHPHNIHLDSTEQGKNR